MSYQSLEIENHGQSAWVWMNRPQIHNAFDEIMIAELTDGFAKLDADETVRVIVLAGRGKSFSAGANLNWMERAAAATEQENLRDARTVAGMLKTIDRMSKPTVARVHGPAFGGGVGLTAVCDIAIASSAAIFATTEVRFGLSPSTISPYVIAAIGPRIARRYFLTAERFGADEACRIGLLHEVCAPETIDERITGVIDFLVAGGPKAQAAAKDLVRRVAGREIDDRLIESTAQSISQLRATPEAKEGTRAFFEKRKPVWNK